MIIIKDCNEMNVYLRGRLHVWLLTSEVQSELTFDTEWRSEGAFVTGIHRSDIWRRRCLEIVRGIVGRGGESSLLGLHRGRRFA